MQLAANNQSIESNKNFEKKFSMASKDKYNSGPSQNIKILKQAYQ